MYHRRPHHRPATIIAAATVVASLACAQTPATGLHARANPADYAVSQQTTNATYAASLIPANQVKQLFAVDISKKFLVFEVACYPSQSGNVPLSRGDFLIKFANNSDVEHPTDAYTVAAFIQDKNSPPLVPNRGAHVTTGVSVAHVSGPGVHGTYTEAGVGVDNYPDNNPPPSPRPGSTPQDRIALENQLSDKSLPQGAFTAPVAGFLYFAAEPLKKAKGDYDLQHLSDNAGKVDLLVPLRQNSSCTLCIVVFHT